MKANDIFRPAILTLLSLGLAACDGNDPDEQGNQPSLDEILETRAAFEAAMNKSGTAQGSDFSGTYATTFSGGNFSDDCTVAFVRSMDFYVNDSASDQELRRVLDEVVPDYPVTIDIVQQDGRITLDADGDGVEGSLHGWIDADGSFQALAGIYEDDGDYWVAIHAGTIQDGRLEGIFVQLLKFREDVDVPGSCTWSANVEARSQASRSIIENR